MAGSVQAVVSELNGLDIVLLVIMVLAAIGGWRSSGASRVGRLAGLLLGALLGLAVAGLVTPLTASDGLRLVIAVVLLLFLEAKERRRLLRWPSPVRLRLG